MLEKSVTWFFLLISMLYFVLAHSLKLGTVTAPKSGFLPVLAGGAAVLLSFLLVVRQTSTAAENLKTSKTSWRKFLLVLLGLLLYIMLLNVVHYFVASFIILVYFFKVTDTAGWFLPITVAAGVSFTCYIIFTIKLGIVFQ